MRPPVAPGFSTFRTRKLRRLIYPTNLILPRLIRARALIADRVSTRRLIAHCEHNCRRCEYYMRRARERQLATAQTTGRKMSERVDMKNRAPRGERRSRQFFVLRVFFSFFFTTAVALNGRMIDRGCVTYLDVAAAVGDPLIPCPPTLARQVSLSLSRLFRKTHAKVEFSKFAPAARIDDSRCGFRCSSFFSFPSRRECEEARRGHKSSSQKSNLRARAA